MQIPGGILMDKFGIRKILVPGMCLFNAGVLIVGFAQGIGVVYAGSLLAGLGSGAYYSGAFTLSTRLIPAARKSFWTAFINSGCAVGMILGLCASTFAVKSCGMDWHYLAFGLFALTLVWIAFFARALEGPGQALGKGGPGFRFADVRPLLGRSQLASYFYYFCTCYGYYMISTWLPSFLLNERAFQGTLAGYCSTVVAIVSIPTAMLFGKVIDRTASHRTAYLVALQALAAISLALLASCRQQVVILLLLAIYAICGKQVIDAMIVPARHQGPSANAAFHGAWRIQLFRHERFDHRPEPYGRVVRRHGHACHGLRRCGSAYACEYCDLQSGQQKGSEPECMRKRSST